MLLSVELTVAYIRHATISIHSKSLSECHDRRAVGYCVDGGGSKTEFTIEDGQILSTTRTSGSNYQDVGIEGLNGLLEGS